MLAILFGKPKHLTTLHSWMSKTTSKPWRVESIPTKTWVGVEEVGSVENGWMQVTSISPSCEMKC